MANSSDPDYVPGSSPIPSPSPGISSGSETYKGERDGPTIELELRGLLQKHVRDALIEHKVEVMHDDFVKSLQDECNQMKELNCVQTWFNNTRGQALRLLHPHKHLVSNKGYFLCALCGHRNKNVRKKRPKTHAHCSVCTVNLCNTNKPEEPGLTCWEHWHSEEMIVPRDYPPTRGGGAGPSSA